MGTKAYDPRPRIGARIKEARLSQHLTQPALGKKLGVSFQVIQSYERGRKLSLDRVTSLASIFHVEPEWLLTGMHAREVAFTTAQLLSGEAGFYTRYPQTGQR